MSRWSSPLPVGRGALPAILAAALACSLLAAAPAAAAGQARPKEELRLGPPVLAYYYIWFTPTSWNRAKSDYPVLGRYSSDETRVMRQHVRWAKQAGIEGFVVSWKSTPDLDARLERLIRVAEEEQFGLALMYQGLDFERRPLPRERVANDLRLFADRYASSTPFRMFDRPLVIWSGTWKFTPEEVDLVTSGVRDRLFVLASGRNVGDYTRLAHAVDGNAYYWSSVNPDTYPKYAEKLAAMGEAVRANDGIWIPPAAPGFDARLLEGRTVVAREDGEMLRRQWSTALASGPDALGLISWNEFSENTHVEPSRKHGERYLEVVRELVGKRVTADLEVEDDPLAASDFDSSGPEGLHDGTSSLLALGGMASFALVSVGAVARRNRARTRARARSGSGPASGPGQPPAGGAAKERN